MERPGTPFSLEVTPRLPREISRLQELANNLWFSWDRHARSLFARLDPELWDAVGHSPKALLKSVDQSKLDHAAHDPVFLHDYDRTLATYDAYHGRTPARAYHQTELRDGDLIAYFCAEFGFHESLPIYSGGLGILAGDHCKTASDMALPFVAVGLLYRQGYFQQTIDAEGTQHASYYDNDFGDLPITSVLGKDGAPLEISVEFAENDVWCKVCSGRFFSWSVSPCTCSTPTTRRIGPSIARPPIGFTAATATRASSRRSSSAWAASARCRRWASSQPRST